MKYLNKSQGMTLVEVVVATAIILAFVLALAGVLNTFVRSSLDDNFVTEGAYLAEEGIEAMKLIRDQGWTAKIAPLAATSTYYLYYAGGTWTTTTTPALVDNTFTRTITVAAVNRDSNSGDIVTSGGTLDTNTKLITSTISWLYHAATTTRSVSTYITNLNSD